MIVKIKVTSSNLDPPEEASAEVKCSKKEAEKFKETHFWRSDIQLLLHKTGTKNCSTGMNLDPCYIINANHCIMHWDSDAKTWTVRTWFNSKFLVITRCCFKILGCIMLWEWVNDVQWHTWTAWESLVGAPTARSIQREGGSGKVAGPGGGIRISEVNLKSSRIFVIFGSIYHDSLIWITIAFNHLV